MRIIIKSACHGTRETLLALLNHGLKTILMYLGRSATVPIRWLLLPWRYVGVDGSLAYQRLSASGNSYLVCGSLGLSLPSLLASQCLC